MIGINLPFSVFLQKLRIKPRTFRLSSSSIPPTLHREEGSLWLTCASLRDVHPLAQHCFLFYTSGVVSIPARTSRLVTSACDRLCAQETFFGENAMSKQAQCATCHCPALQALSKVEGDCCSHGFICPQGHWGRPSHTPRDFSTDKYCRH